MKLRNNLRSKKLIFASAARWGVKEKNNDAYEEYARRIRKTLYYGKLPSTERPSLPVTEFMVDNVGKLCKQDGLDQLSLHEASSVCYEACVTPCSVIVAILYLDRLRTKNPEYLASTSPSQVFISALMVASKYLYDDGEEDEVFNDEWAKSAALTLSDLNEAEKNFLSAIDWHLFVDLKSFKKGLLHVESTVAINQGTSRGYFIYSDLLTLSKCLPPIWTSFISLVGSAVVLCIIGYTASVLVIVAGTLVTRDYSQVANEIRLSIRTPIIDSHQSLGNCSRPVKELEDQPSYTSSRNNATDNELSEKLKESVVNCIQGQNCFSSKIRFSALRALTTALLLASSSEATEHPSFDSGLRLASTASLVEPFCCYDPSFELRRDTGSIIPSYVSSADVPRYYDLPDGCQNFNHPAHKPPSRRKWRKPKFIPKYEKEANIFDNSVPNECSGNAADCALPKNYSPLRNDTPDQSLSIYAYLNYTTIIIDYIEKFMQTKLDFSFYDDIYSPRDLDYTNGSLFGITDICVTLPNHYRYRYSFLPSDEAPPETLSLLPSWIASLLPFSVSERFSDYVAVDGMSRNFALLE